MEGRHVSTAGIRGGFVVGTAAPLEGGPEVPGTWACATRVATSSPGREVLVLGAGRGAASARADVRRRP